MEKKRKVVHVGEQIGNGGYQQAYRVSQRRIVKIPKLCYNDKQAKHILDNEIAGSKHLLNALPVLDVVDVVLPDGQVRQGTLRRYIPLEAKYKEVENLFKKAGVPEQWDSSGTNFRKDTRGKLWRTDTQTQDIWNLI